MRIDWRKYTIKDIIEALFDGPHATPAPADEGPVFLGIKNLTEDGRIDLSEIRHIAEEDFPRWTKRVLPRKDDIVFTYEATLHRYGLIQEGLRCCLGRRMALLRLNKNIVDPHFLLYYFFSSEWRQTVERNIIIGATVNRIPLSDYSSFQLSLPDLETQGRIAAILSALDDKIALNTRINAELEGMAKLLYDYWFVQFDFPMPEAYAAAIGQPQLAGQPYKSSGGEMVYNEQLKREVPVGWAVKPLADWIATDKSGDWGKDSVQGNYVKEVRCIRGADLNGLNGEGNLKAPTRFILEKNSHKILDPYDLIVEISGGSPTQSTGRLSYVTASTLERFQVPLICSNFCKALSLKDETYLFNFVYLWSRLYNHGVLFGWEGKTSGIKNLLFQSFIDHQYTVYPNPTIAQLFSEFVTPIHDKKQKNLQENQHLRALRDWLLPLLMNGQVRVGE